MRSHPGTTILPCGRCGRRSDECHHGWYIAVSHGDQEDLDTQLLVLPSYITDQPMAVFYWHIEMNPVATLQVGGHRFTFARSLISFLIRTTCLVVSVWSRPNIST